MALFFQSMFALLSPVKPIKSGIKRALIVHTVLMFSLLTAPYAIDLNYLSISYIDNREYPGFNADPPGSLGYFPGSLGYFPGPLGYHILIGIAKATATTLDVMFPLRQWLADGLLVGPI